MMNKKGQLFLMVLILAAVIILTTLSFIQPYKENLDVATGAGGLRCSDPSIPLLSHKLTCWTLQGSMVFFVGCIVWAVIAWIMRGRKNNDDE
jgi:hypothetical protein